MAKLGYPPAPLVLALILTPMLESALRQSLSMAHGSPWVFAGRPVALVLMGAGIALTLSTLVSRRRR
jgi:putative tricarboxylic transport membrane protein